jgi:predicted TIM-barrel fold metal-dependent hydrolase
MADEPFIDTHIHFWDHSVPGLDWAWLRPGFMFRKWEAAAALDAPRYSIPEYLAEAEGTGLAACVHVQAAEPLERPVLETEWLESVADEHGMPDAIVGRCLLHRPDATEVLRDHARHGRFRGVRDHESAKHLVVEDIVPAMDVLAELGMSVELRRSHDEFDVLEQIADRWPSVTLALSHGCLPLERTPADRAAWAAAMARVATHPNVVCKISAVAGASDPEWTPDSIRPWILSCVEIFGADRCMLGSNFPVDRLFGSLPALVDGYRQATAELTAPERASIFHRTAERVYRVDAPPPAATR